MHLNISTKNAPWVHNVLKKNIATDIRFPHFDILIWGHNHGTVHPNYIVIRCGISLPIKQIMYLND